MIHFNQNIHDLQGFNISSKDLFPLLKDLKVGQIIRTKVIENMDKNEILILLNGQKLSATTNLNFKEGDILFLKVQSVKPSLVLQLYGIETSNESNPSSELLRMFNLYSNKINQQIINSLIKYNLPINQQEIQEIINSLNDIFQKLMQVTKEPDTNKSLSDMVIFLNLQKITIEDINILDSIIFLKSQNIPVTPRTVLMTLEYLSQKHDIGNDLNQLRDLVLNNKFIPKDFINRFGSLFDEKLDLEKIIKNIGFDYEKKIYDLIRGKSKDELNLNNNLKGILLELNRLIMNDARIDNSEKLFLLSMRILNNIEIQQLINMNESTWSKNWYFNIPVLLGDFFKSIELKINSNKDGNIKFSNRMLSFNLNLEMSNLGKISSSGNVIDNNLSLFFGLEEKELCTEFEKDIGELKQRLIDLGYNIAGIHCDIIREDSDNLISKFYDEKNKSLIDVKI
jgi:hypothetical protein